MVTCCFMSCYAGCGVWFSSWCGIVLGLLLVIVCNCSLVVMALCAVHGLLVLRCFMSCAARMECIVLLSVAMRVIKRNNTTQHNKTEYSMQYDTVQ